MASYSKRKKQFKKFMAMSTPAKVFCVILLLAALLFSAWRNGSLDGFIKSAGLDGIIPTSGRETSAPAAEGLLALHVIDIGQGDSVLIKSPDDRYMLIDSGPGSDEDALISYLDANLVGGKLDYAVFTHPHEDHIGGGDVVLEEYDVSSVIMPDSQATTAAFERLLERIGDEGCGIDVPEEGAVYSLGEYVTFTVLAAMDDDENLNNTSLVIRLDYGENSFMFTGDAEAEVEEYLVSKYGVRGLDCDFLKVGHHGSSTSNTEEFVTAVSPKYAAISCAEANDYGHPHREVSSLLEKYSIETGRTDLSGDLVYISDGVTVTPPAQ